MSEEPKKNPAPLWARVIATGFGSGLIRPAPGTWGSLVGLVLCGLAVRWDFSRAFDVSLNIASNRFMIIHVSVLLVVAIAATVLGLISAQIYSRRTGIKDPKEVVIDEIAGQSIALLGINAVGHEIASGTQLLIELVLAFVLFRLFDIWKPWPIRRLEKLPGGWGIMGDDLAAGALAGAILAGLIRMKWIPGMG